MTDDEILAKAAEIKARRDRCDSAERFMRTTSVQINARDNDGSFSRSFVPSAEFAAFLCHIFDCDITEGLK